MKKFREIIVTLCFIAVLIITVTYFGTIIYEGIDDADLYAIEGTDLLWYQIFIAIILIRYPIKEKINNMIRFLKNSSKKQNNNNNGKAHGVKAQKMKKA